MAIIVENGGAKPHNCLSCSQIYFLIWPFTLLLDTFHWHKVHKVLLLNNGIMNTGNFLRFSRTPSRGHISSSGLTRGRIWMGPMPHESFTYFQSTCNIWMSGVSFLLVDSESHLVVQFRTCPVFGVFWNMSNPWIFSNMWSDGLKVTLSSESNSFVWEFREWEWRGSKLCR